MVKVEDVARAAGVSKSTASRALRGHPEIKAETVSRVRAAAADLNYVPNHVASSLALRRTNTIVLFVNNLLSRQTDEFHDGVEAACAAHGFLMLLQKLDESRERKARYLQLLSERRVDGVIVVPDIGSVHAEEIAQIRKRGTPVVLIDNEVEGTGTDYVGCDNTQGAWQVADHLLSLGHSRFGIVSAVRPLSCIRERIEAFQEALARQGLPPAPVHIRRHSQDPGGAEYGRRATHTLLDLPERPTALFSVSDPGALGVLRAISERGLRCPEDVAVASFDNDNFGAYLETSLTSVHWPAFDIGRQAAEILIRRVQGEETGPPQRLLIETTLIHRESTLGALRKRSSEVAGEGPPSIRETAGDQETG